MCEGPPRWVEEVQSEWASKSHEPLKVADQKEAERSGQQTWASDAFRTAALSKGQQEWMRLLEKGDLRGVMPKMSQFLRLTGKELKSNPRATREYAAKCLKEAELGPHFNQDRYKHLTEQADKDALAWAVQRGAGCIWLEDSERTYVRAFKHRLVTKGAPVRVGLHRLSRPDMEWVEKAISEDVARGQLVKGSSDWGFPAFRPRK